MYRNFRPAVLLLVFVFQFKSHESFNIQSEDLSSKNYATKPYQNAPINFVVSFMSENILKISWTAPAKWAGVEKLYLINWFKDGVEQPSVTLGEDFYYMITGLLIPGTKFNFYVQAKTTVSGNAVLSTTLPGEAVVEIQKPRDLEVTEFNSTSITINWQEPKPKVQLTGYEVTLTSSYPTTDETMFYSEAGEVVLSDLAGWTTYDIQVAAYYININKEEFIGPITKISVTTDVGKPGPCRSLKIYQGQRDNTTVTLSWDKPGIPNGPIDGYYFTYRQDNNTQGPMGVHSILRQIKITNLLMDTKYTFQLVAFNKQLIFPSTEIRSEIAQIEVTTNPGEPSEPTELTEGEISNTSLQIKWKRPQNPRGPITGYIISCDVCDIKEIETSETQYTFKGLKPQTRVNIGVRGFNKAVNPGADRFIGEEKKLSTGTYTREPSPCRNFRVTQEYLSPVALLTWSRPSEPNGPIDGYRITYDYNRTLEVVSDEPVVKAECQVEEDQHYIFLVQAFNNELMSKKVPAVFQADPGVPKLPDLQTEIPRITKTSITISWPIDPKFIASGYLINCDGCGSREEINTTSYSYTFDGLQPRTNITVRVKAYNLARNNGNRPIIGPEAKLEATTTSESGVGSLVAPPLIYMFIQLLAWIKASNIYTG